MNFVYILQSLHHPRQIYTGLTDDVQARLRAHNAGTSAHTAHFKPWKLVSLSLLRAAGNSGRVRAMSQHRLRARLRIAALTTNGGH